MRVEFRVNGALVHTADDPTLNERVNVWEHWFTFDPAGYPDGAVTIDARAIALNGTDPDYDLPSLSLYANSGASLDVAAVTWVDAVNGSDAGSGVEADPYQTLNKAVDSTPVGGTIYLKAGSYDPDGINAGMSRAYWTTVSAAPGLGWDDVEITPGRPSTDKLRLKNLSIVTTSTSGAYTTILSGEQGATTIWLDDVKAWNKNGRYAASTNVMGNGYSCYTTGGMTTQTANGPAGGLVRDHHVQSITSDVFTGGGRLVVNCTADDTDPGPTSAHPDFHQSYAVDPGWCQDVILYNVRGTNQNCQGLFGVRLRNAAFVNVMIERVPDVDFRCQYSDVMENVLYSHVTLINYIWYWRGSDPTAYAATDVTVNNSIMILMKVIEDAAADGLTIDSNHFHSDTTTMGTNVTTGDPLYVDPVAEDYHLQSGSAAAGTGAVLQCVPADLDGVPYSAVAPNKGSYSSTAWLAADAGPDQIVTDDDGDGFEDITLDGSESFGTTGAIVSYVWRENATQIATDAAPVVTLAVAVHSIDLTVTDEGGATDTDTVIVTVNPQINLAPIADAGPDQVVLDDNGDGLEDIALDGAGSEDVDGSLVSYVWENNGAPIATGASPTVTLAIGAYTIDLTVTDNRGATDSDSVVVTVAAQTYAINGDTADQERRSDGGGAWYGDSTNRIGGSTSSADGAVIYVFQLPTIQPGEKVLGAGLDFNLHSIANSPGGHVDLYGLGYRPASSVLSTDFFQGAFGSDATDAWPLQDDILTLETPSGLVSTDAIGGAALAAYIEAQYASGAGGGEYVFLRLNPDVANVSSYHYWRVTMANSTPKPVLTLHVGEPAEQTGPGDADGDGDVDLDDFVILKLNFGRNDVTAGAAEGDFDADGDVDLDDFVILKNNFGS